MSKRNYNVFFNTHTVSGIVISVALYIIFFAGAFALFKDEIAIWEDGKKINHTLRRDINFDSIIHRLDDEYDLNGRDISFVFKDHSDNIYSTLKPSRDSLASEKGKRSQYVAIDINTSEIKSYTEKYNLGEFLYRLHFLTQIPYIGVYLAGFIAFFFLFAIVTGVIVHWKKIISNFFKFNPKVILKKVWTDAHTALGFIGLPFQFTFAITGAYFCLSILVLIPANILFNGNQNLLLESLRPDRKIYQWAEKSNEVIPSYNLLIQKTATNWDNFQVKSGHIKNYGRVNMKYIINGELNNDDDFIGLGRIVFNAFTGEIEAIKNPNKTEYSEDIQRLITKLHFGDFGGIPIKIIYFILALITCFVIITGVLIWIEARNKKNSNINKRLFTAKVGHIYLAICLSMLPVTALSFLFVKIFNNYFNNQQTAIYTFFFSTWLIFTLFFRFKRNNYFTNKLNLLLGAIFGFMIPMVNGFVSNNWMWKMYNQQQYDILSIDVLWILIAALSLLFYVKIKPNIKEQSAFIKNPIDYNNIKTEKQKLNNNNFSNKSNTKHKNYIKMRTKISILWILLALGWIIHHMYGLFNIYYNETLIMEGANGEAPLTHHIYRILFEGFCFMFGLLTLEVSKTWFKWISFVWAIIAGIYNVYHFFEAMIYESSNISEIFMLALVSLTSLFLIKALNTWKKYDTIL